MMNKLQLVLTDVLIRSIFNTNVLLGSVLTRLRCDEISNDQFITQSLLSLKVKKIENQSTFAICRNYGQLISGLFYETWCIYYLM